MIKMNEKDRKEYFEEFLENNYLYNLYKEHKRKMNWDDKNEEES